MKFEQFKAKITKKNEEVNNEAEVKKEFDTKMNETKKEFWENDTFLTDKAKKLAQDVDFGETRKYGGSEWQNIDSGVLKDNLRMVENIKQKAHSVESLWDKVVEKNREFKNKLLASKIGTFTGVVGGLTASLTPLVDKITDGGVWKHAPQLANMIPDFATSMPGSLISNSEELVVAMAGGMITLFGGIYGGSLISKFKTFTDNERLLKTGAMVINKHNELHGTSENTEGLNPDIEEKIES